MSHLHLVFPTERSEDPEYVDLLALLRRLPACFRDGRAGPQLSTLEAQWPDDDAHAELERLAQALVARYSGRLAGTRDSDPSSAGRLRAADAAPGSCEGHGGASGVYLALKPAGAARQVG